jgi:hypothetical protein
MMALQRSWRVAGESAATAARFENTRMRLMRRRMPREGVRTRREEREAGLEEAWVMPAAALN